MIKSLRKERMTAQKTLISGYLKGVKTHPTAETIFEKIKKRLPNISQGTVYRVLNNLKERGDVQIIETKDIAHFDADISDHAHFICEECGNVYDVMCKCCKCEILKNKKTNVGAIKKYKINFYGICSTCRQKNEKNKK